MKRTTYILIGIFISGLIVIIIGSWMISRNGKQSAGLVFSGETVEMDIAPYRVVNISLNTGDKGKTIWNNDGKGLCIVPSVNGKNRLSYPESLKKYFEVESIGDTLYLNFDFSDDVLPQDQRNRMGVLLSEMNMTLTADSLFTDLQSNMSGLQVCLKEIKADSLTLASSGLRVDDCEFRALSVYNTNQIELDKSEIASFYLNLDGVNNWKVSDCRIGTEYLTGSGHHYCELSKGGYRQMIWQPQGKDAKLQVSLNDKATVLVGE